jgi:hypothetical protein
MGEPPLQPTLNTQTEQIKAGDTQSAIDEVGE